MPVGVAGCSKSSVSPLPLGPVATSGTEKPRQKTPAASAAAPPHNASISTTLPLALASSPGAARTRGDGMAVRHRRSSSHSPRHSPYSRSPAGSPKNESPASSPCHSPCHSPHPEDKQPRSRSKLPVSTASSLEAQASASREDVPSDEQVSAALGFATSAAYHDLVSNVPPTLLGLYVVCIHVCLL